MPAAVAARALDLGVPLLAAALRGETTGRAQAGDVTYAAKIAPGDRRIDWRGPAAAIANQVRALSSAYRRQNRARRPPGDVLEGARNRHARRCGARHRNGRGRRVVADCVRSGGGRGARAAAGREAADGGRRVPARPAHAAGAGDMSARLAAYEVVRRTFEEGAYADRAFPPEADEGPAGRARPAARDAPGIRHGPARPHARLRDGGARVAPTGAAPADPAGGAAARRLPDPLRGRHPRPRRGQRDGGARQGGRGPPHRGSCQRRAAPGRRGGPGVGRDAAARPAPLLSRLDRGRVDGDAGRGRGRRPDGRPERAARARRAGEHAARRPARPWRPRARRSRAARGAGAGRPLRRGREPRTGRRRDLAAVARLDAGGAPARTRAGDARARPVLGAGRQGRPAGGAHGRSRHGSSASSATPAGPPRSSGRSRSRA